MPAGEAPNDRPFGAYVLPAPTRPGRLGGPGSRRTWGLPWIAMAMPQDSASSTPLIDDWVAEAGEAAVAAEVEEARRRIDEGSLPSFDDPAALLAFVMRGRRQSA